MDLRTFAKDAVGSGLYSHGLFSRGLYSHGPYSYGPYSCGLYRYARYSYGMLLVMADTCAHEDHHVAKATAYISMA